MQTLRQNYGMSGIERVKKFQFLFNTVPFVLIIAFQGNDNKFTNDKDNVFDKFQQYFAAVPASIFCCYPHVNISLLSPRQYVAAVPASIFRCYPRVNISLLSPRQYFAAVPASIFRCCPRVNISLLSLRQYFAAIPRQYYAAVPAFCYFFFFVFCLTIFLTTPNSFN